MDVISDIIDIEDIRDITDIMDYPHPNIYSLKLVEITRAPFCSSHVVQGGDRGVRAGNKKVDLVSLCSRKGNMKPNENCNPSCPARGKLLRLNPCDYHSLSQTPVVIIRH